MPGESRNWLPPREVQAVDPDHEAGRRLAAGEELVDQLGDGRAEGGPVAPHVELAGQPLDLVERRVAAVRLVVVAGRQVDPERPLVRVAERVAPQRLADDHVLLEAPLQGPGPWLHAITFTRAGACARSNLSILVTHPMCACPVSGRRPSASARPTACESTQRLCQRNGLACPGPRPGHIADVPRRFHHP